MDQPEDAGAATDAATLNSDAAVVEGGIKRREGDTPTPPPPQEAEVINNDHAAPAVGGSPKAGGNTQARRRDYRKRALSSATNGTLETNGSMNGNTTSDNNNGFSGLSFMQNASLGSNIMGSGGESIVSFGLNFNFDNTSSPSNSDSGEGGGTKKKKSDGKDASDDKKTAAKPPAAPDTKDVVSGGNNKGKNNSKGSSSNQKHSSKSPKSSKKASPSGTNGEDGSDPNSSDSSLNNDSGGSASGGDSNSGSGSGGDGSGGSGWKSTISSLTTSSNQEWMATNDSAAAAAAVVAAVEATAAANKATGASKMSPEGMETDGRPAAVNQDAAVGGKKRKADATKGTNGRREDDDGYKTDEEQWGGRGVNKDGNVIRPNISSHKGALKVSTQKSDGPPVKQARFNLDQHPSAVAVARTDDSQQPVSSLTGSSGTDSASADAAAVTASATAHQTSSATPATSFNPISASAQNTGAPNPVTSDGKRGGGAAAAAGGKKTTMDAKRREQRNAREKERSCRIAKQIDDLRSLLSRGGVIVAKGTKSSVLSETANYINLLQQQQIQWELDRQALIQQMHQVGAAPLQQVLPQNMAVAPTQMPAAAASQPAAQINSISPNDYKFVFNNSSLGMAIASMGGAFVDCNDIFCKLSDYTKAEVCSMTIFNMTARTDLQHAFDLISQMITPPSTEDQQKKSNTIVLRGAMKNRNDLGLSVSLIKGDLGIAKCFCVTLVKIVSMENSRPDTVSIEMELPHVESSSKQQSNGFGVFPAYTSG